MVTDWIINIFSLLGLDAYQSIVIGSFSVPISSILIVIFIIYVLMIITSICRSINKLIKL